jgi:uncharacterized membrane protein
MAYGDVYLEVGVAVIGFILLLIIMPNYLKKTKGYARGLFYGVISFTILEFIMIYVAKAFFYDSNVLAGLISQGIMVVVLILGMIVVLINTKIKK